MCKYYVMNTVGIRNRQLAALDHSWEFNGLATNTMRLCLKVFRGRVLFCAFLWAWPGDDMTNSKCASWNRLLPWDEYNTLSHAAFVALVDKVVCTTTQRNIFGQAYCRQGQFEIRLQDTLQKGKITQL